MQFPITELAPEAFPELLHEIPDPPKRLFVRGNLPPQDVMLLAVVGSRDYTTYGKQVVEHLIGGLRGYPVSIVSGLALGIDELSHEAALRAGLYTLAVPGSGINDKSLYPARNRGLAKRILESGGGILSEYDPNQRAANWMFPQRNRIMAGLSHATLMIEATEKSGTLITARLCADYNRELLVVPGNIFSENTKGSHQFLKLGATPVTCADDILDALGVAHEIVAAEQNLFDSTLTAPEQKLLSLLSEPKEKDALIRALGISTADASVLLMQMEINGHIVIDNGVVRRGL